MIVPMLCVGMQGVTLRVTLAQVLGRAWVAGRGASQDALPRGAWERSVEWVEPVGGFGLLFSSMAGDSNGCFQVVARANDRMYLRP